MTSHLQLQPGPGRGLGVEVCLAGVVGLVEAEHGVVSGQRGELLAPVAPDHGHEACTHTHHTPCRLRHVTAGHLVRAPPPPRTGWAGCPSCTTRPPPAAPPCPRTGNTRARCRHPSWGRRCRYHPHQHLQPGPGWPGAAATTLLRLCGGQ